ncbi:unnamed protein product [Acanthoscelides obtectus]|uniref:E3 ubiquitin-protein ligase PPP1R11 n=1 Tax=Acanthoscelides obtectus TaxID=200917 RepID=A0A9P0K1W7_ACAOB|nr:unnamed protein product [Acanthoscelides obtectus]CAK1649352.1 E3 ubiquitin-protein ligase PPP1R11 [Acanthoscelides obtectus]
MAEQIALQEPKEGTTSTVTVVEQDDHDATQANVPSVTLKLRKPKTDRKVKWTTGTVDNENMNKKKSKCCCIYEKPSNFGESSSDDSDEECEHCRGHVEKKNKNKAKPPVAEGDGSCSSLQADPMKSVTIEN